MSEKVRKLKDNAARLIARGKLGEAADEYVKIVKADPRDLTARQKLAEIYARMGRVPDAVHEYQSVAGSYAADGLLLKAIAVCKIILQIDPAHTETQQILADLSTRRRGESVAVEMPKAMSTALAPGAKRSASDIRGVPAQNIKPRERVPGENDRPITNVPPPSSVPVIALGVGAGTPLAHLAPSAGSPVSMPPVPSAADEMSVDVTLAVSAEGAPVIMGHSLSREGAPVAALPADESGADDDDMLAVLQGFNPSAVAPPPPPSDADEIITDDAGDDADVIELTEPAQIDVDKVPPIPLFSDLPREAFIALTERMELRVAGKDDVLVQEGEPGTSMFIIIQGTVVVKRRELDGSADLVLAELNDGAFFGEMALLSDAPRMASVVCADDTMLFEISRELLADITRQYPSVGEVMKRFHKNRLLTNLLKTSPIFQPFSTKDKKDLIEKFKSRSVDEGVYLITRERPGEGLYVVLSGRCEVFDTNEEGKEVLLAELKEGDVFGEMSMLWHKKTCASVKAVSPCVVLRLPRESFNEVIMTHPQILETLTALSERRQKQNQELKTPEVVSDFLV